MRTICTAVLSCGLSIPAWAVCSPAEVCDSTTGDCEVSSRYELDPDCTLDLSGRNLRILGSGELVFDGDASGIGAAEMAMDSGSKLSCSGDDAAPVVWITLAGDLNAEGDIGCKASAGGGHMIFTATGDIRIAGNGIDLTRASPAGPGGQLDISASGNLSIEADLLLHGRGSNPGGTLNLGADGAIVVSSVEARGVKLDVSGGSDAGRIDVARAASITMGDVVLDLMGSNGGAGGPVYLNAIGIIEMMSTAEVRASGAGDQGGGSIYVSTAGDVSWAAPIDLTGGGTGGDGGDFEIETTGGAINFAAEADLRGKTPDGGGGNFTLWSVNDLSVLGEVDGGGRITLQSPAWGGDFDLQSEGSMFLEAELVTKATSPEGTAGGIYTLANDDTFVQGTVDTTASVRDGSAGDIILDTDGDLQVIGTLDSSGTGFEAWAGSIDIVALGTAEISGTLLSDGYDSGGWVSIYGDLGVNMSGPIDARGTGPGATGGLLEVKALFGEIVMSGAYDTSGKSTEVGGGSLEIEACIVRTTAEASLRNVGEERDMIIIAADGMTIDGSLESEDFIQLRYGFVEPTVLGTVIPTPTLIYDHTIDSCDCEPGEEDCVDPDDLDGDGYISVDSGGDDCDDRDENVNPGTAEVIGDGIDNDCNPDTPDDGDPGEDTGTADDTGTPEEETDPEADDSGDSSETPPADSKTDTIKDGCACTTGPSPVPWGPLAMLTGFLVIRRRRFQGGCSMLARG